MSGSDYNRWKQRGYTEEQATTIQLYLRQERARLKKEVSGGGDGARLNRKRFVREQVRRKAKRFYDYEPLSISPLLMASKLKDHELLNGLPPNIAPNGDL